MRKIGKPSRRYVVLTVILVFCALFVGWVEVPQDFDEVFPSRVGDRAGELRVFASGPTRYRRLGLSRKNSGPYSFSVCSSNATRQNLTLKMASLIRVVQGQDVPVDAEFNIDRKWIEFNPRLRARDPSLDMYCMNELLVLDVKIESQEIYCVDLTFDLREVEQVERKCLLFERDISHYEVTLWNLFIGTIWHRFIRSFGPLEHP
jgi:hypothetical protein